MRTFGPTVLTISLLTIAVGTYGAQAANIGVIGKKFIVVDKVTAAGKAKVVYVSKDQTAGISKGTTTNVNSIDTAFEYRYDTTSGRVEMQSGALEPGETEGWKTNKATVAKYVNKAAPSGSTVTKVAVIKPDKLLKVVAKGLGDPPNVIDIFAAGPPSGDVHTAFSVDNGPDLNVHCSTFTECTYKLIAADTGAKLVCKTSTADPTCAALGSPSGAFLD